jgi:hypothetical protein
MFEHFDVSDNSRHKIILNKQTDIYKQWKGHRALIIYTIVNFLAGQCHSLKLIKLAFKITYKFTPI